MDVGMSEPIPTTPCREWQMSRTAAGYGQKTIKGTGRSGYVHRWVMEQVHGKEAIEGKVVMHLCDNPACYRYDHLRIGTQVENMQMSHARGRSNAAWARKKGSEHGMSRLTEEVVVEARRRHQSGATFNALAVEFGVSRCTIRRAVVGETWAHVS